MKILMFYYFTPSASVEYIAKALRHSHDVKSFGPQVPHVSHHNLELKNGYAEVDEIFLKFSKTWTPDLFLMVDGPYSLYPKGISSLPVMTAYYAIDTHISYPAHRALATLFDVVFVAQKQYLNPLQAAGVKNIFWIPLGCDPMVHGSYDLPKAHDICFLGGLHGDRAQFLERLKASFNIYIDFVSHTEMNKIYSQSKIVLNKSIGNDINMRVFEAMSSGSLLVSDRLKQNGLEDLFTDRQDLVLYDNNSAEELLAYYLKNESERAKIALSGYQKVRSFHTYDHRVKQMIDYIQSLENKNMKRKSFLQEEISLKKVRFFQSRFGQWIKQATVKGLYSSVGIQ